MRRRTGPAVNAVDFHHPALRRLNGLPVWSNARTACIGGLAHKTCLFRWHWWRRKRMSIAPQEFVSYMSAAFDGMLSIAEELGDERLNQRPQNMPNTSTPFAILTHCIGLTRYWLGTVIAGRQIARDRDAEFRARGTVADLRQAVHQVKQEIQADITHVQGDQPSAFPAAVRPQHKEWTQGHFLLQCYKELAQYHGHMELTWDIMLGHGPAS